MQTWSNPSKFYETLVKLTYLPGVEDRAACNPTHTGKFDFIVKKNNKKERNFSQRFTGRIGNNKKENKIQEISDESACSDDRETNNNNLIKKIRHREIRHREIRILYLER